MMTVRRNALVLFLALLSAGLDAQVPLPSGLDAEGLLALADEKRFVPNMNFTLTITALRDSQTMETTGLWGWVKSSASGSKTLLMFVAPASSRGRKMLMDGPVVYLLFPKTRNPIRLSPLQVLLGQSSNGDVARTGFSQDYDVSAVRSEPEGNRALWVFDLTAKSAHQGTTYRKVTLRVENESLRFASADFYGSGEVKLKHADYLDYRNVDGKQVPFRLEITDGTDTSKRTILQYETIGKQVLADGAFRKDYLETWSPEAPK